jgi:muramoyltetrapeptide carboxypeptidase
VRSGDTVILVSPASPPEPESVRHLASVLEGWGLVVEMGAHVFEVRDYLAGRDEERLADLNAALRAPDVRAIIATRGGKGSYRIAGQLDVSAARSDPKFLVGFSDITILQASLWKGANVVSIHGSVSVEGDGTSLRAALMGIDDITIERVPTDASARLTTRGRAAGRLLGGNLEMIATAAGWCLPPLDGAILLLEAVNQAIGAVDRQLTRLRRAGHLDGVHGVAVGRLVEMSERTVDVIGEHLSALNVLILGGLPIGHGPNARCVYLGTTASLDADSGRIWIDGCVRSRIHGANSPA